MTSVKKYQTWKLKDTEYWAHTVWAVNADSKEWPVIGYVYEMREGYHMPATWDLAGRCKMVGRKCREYYSDYVGRFDLVDPKPDFDRVIGNVWTLVREEYKYLTWGPRHGWRVWKTIPKLSGGEWFQASNTSADWGTAVGMLGVFDGMPKGLPLGPGIWKRPE